MLTFTVRRLLYGVLLLFVIVTLAYLLLYAAAGNVARTILGPTATQATVTLKNQQLGLNTPLISRYFSWLGHALTGNFGSSWFTNQAVTTAILTRLQVTLTLVFGAVIVSAVLSAVLGVWAALRGGWVDRFIQVFTVLGFAIPGFIIAVFLVRFFALGTHWFKPTGYVPLTTSFSGWVSTVTLPVIALSIGLVAGVAQQVRSRGISERSVLFKHVLRNAGGPALSVLALSFVGLLGGAVIIEEVFGIPGLGQVAVLATSEGDVPLVMGLVVAIGVIVILVNLVIDLLQGFLNPKARIS